MVATTQTEEPALTARLSNDLDGAFPDLVVAYQDAVYSGVRRLVPNAADAEDVTQETFVRAYRAMRGYPPERIAGLALRGWLWTIALNLCRNAARRRSRKPDAAPLGLANERPADGDTAAEAVARVAESVWHERLSVLPQPMRTAVVLRHVVGLGYAEIAEAADRPVGTVKADVHRGLARLRRMLEEESGEER